MRGIMRAPLFIAGLLAAIAAAGCNGNPKTPPTAPSATAMAQSYAQQHGADIKKAYEASHPAPANP